MHLQKLVQSAYIFKDPSLLFSSKQTFKKNLGQAVQNQHAVS